MNWLDISILSVVAIGLIKGLFDGFVKQIISSVSLVLAIFFAGKTARPLRDMLVNIDFVANLVSPHIITVICYILSFSLILLIFKWLSILLNKTIKVTPISCLNYALGGFLGVIFSLFILSLIFNIITGFDSNSKLIKAETKEQSILFFKVEKLVTFIAPLVKEVHKVKEELPPSFQKEKENRDSQKETNQVFVFNI